MRNIKTLHQAWSHCAALCAENRHVMLTGEFKAALIRNQSTTCSWINGWTTLHYLSSPYTMLWGIVWWQVCYNCNDTSEDLDKCGTNPHGMRHGCVTRSDVLHTYNVRNVCTFLGLCPCIAVFIQQDGIQWSFALRSSCCKIATAKISHSNLLDLCGTVGGGTFGVSTNSNSFWTFDTQNIKQLSMVLASGEVLCSTICDISAPAIPLSGLIAGNSVLAKSSLHHQETWTWMHQCGRPPNLAQAQQIYRSL